MARRDRWVGHATVTLSSDDRGVLLEAPTGEEGWLPTAIALEVLEDPRGFADRVAAAVARLPVPFALAGGGHA